MNGRHRFARLALAAGAAVVILAAGVPARADHSVDPSADQAPATEPPAEEPLPGDEPPVTEPPVEEPPPETPPVEDPTVTSPPPDRDGPVGSQQAGSEATREAAPTRLGDFPPAVGSVTIHKRGDGFDPLGGATFELLDYPLGTPTCTTDTEGVCTLSDLIPGSYRVHEATAPGGFSPIDNITQSGTPSDYAKPVTVSAAADTSDVSFVNVRDNAPSAGGCGINIVLVLDRSGSVAPFASDYIAAANAFVDALVGTPSQIAVVSFAGQASVD
ncbi:MAG: SpaA isopeptide-forming pilin-related protein, partial [Acidimicrobiia bacterium]